MTLSQKTNNNRFGIKLDRPEVPKFIKLTIDIIDSLDCYALKIYSYLRKHADYSLSEDEIELSQKQIAIETKLSESTVKRSINKLINTHFLMKKMSGRRLKGTSINCYLLSTELNAYRNEFLNSVDNSSMINNQSVSQTDQWVCQNHQWVSQTDHSLYSYREEEKEENKNPPNTPLPVDNFQFQAKDNGFSVFEDPRPIPQCPGKDDRPNHQPQKKPEKGPKNIKNILDKIKVPLKTSFEAENKAIEQRSQKSSTNVAGQEIIEKNNANGDFKSAEEKNKEIDKIKQILSNQELKPASSPHIGVPFRCLDKEPTNEQRFVAKFNNQDKNLSAKKDYPVTKRLQELTQNLNDEEIRSFEYFWELYPMKKNKYLSMVSWFEHDCHEKVVDILYKLQAQINEDHHFKSGMIPNPENYISTFRWEDEIWKPKNPKELDFHSSDWALKENYGLLD